MYRALSFVAAGALLLAPAILPGLNGGALAQPAKGAPAAFERVRDTMANRFKDQKLSGDPDRDFADLLIAAHEETLFLAKTQLEYGGDRQLRQAAQKIQDDQQKLIDELKTWQVRSRQSDYKAQPDQPPPGSGPLDRGSAPGPQTAAQAEPPPAAPPASAASMNLPVVSATVEDINPATGKITLDHGAIPNLNMDGMTMVFRAADPAMLKQVKKGDKVRFSADRVNGQLTLIKIQKGR